MTKLGNNPVGLQRLGLGTVRGFFCNWNMKGHEVTPKNYLVALMGV
jgi:hypothetical protein